ncbi:hypothetical protein [Paenarthrobacter histidinolovorans]|uniref:Uncharacterized protein n=1 Tax=Paenarthrobacter histidinolovorans TaxID=43664 RepID=A0ABW8MZK3_9MICC
MSNILDSFQSQLLEDLKQNVGHQPSRTLRRRAAVLGGGALVAAAVTAGFVVTNVLAPAPAYAVSEQSDGAIHITLNALSDAEGLKAELLKHGITADVSYGSPEMVTLDSGPLVQQPQPVPGGVSSSGTSATFESSASAGGEGTMPSAPNPGSCGVTGKAPEVQIEEGKAVIDIPQGSLPPAGTPLKISTAGGTTSFAGLTVTWGNCGVGTATVGTLH